MTADAPLLLGMGRTRQEQIKNESTAYLRTAAKENVGNLISVLLFVHPSSSLLKHG
jgi:hypothetical protein